MTTGTVPRVLLAAACFLGLVGGVVVLSGAVPASSVASSPSSPANPSEPAAVSTAAAPTLDSGPAGEPATVLAVADPITVDVRLAGGRALRVRVVGVQPPARCYADQAMQFARGILDNKAVTLVGDGRTDRFSRALAQVSLPQGDYAVLAAEAGVVTTYAPEAPAERMPAVRAAQGRAEDARRGVWGPPCASGS